MNDYPTVVTENRRLELLVLLAESAGYQASAPLAQMALEAIGYSVALASIDADMAWLRDAGLATAREVGGLQIATLTPRGLDVAKGRVHVPGVARPRPWVQ